MAGVNNIESHLTSSKIKDCHTFKYVNTQTKY